MTDKPAITPVSFSLAQIGMVLSQYNPLSEHDFKEIMTVFREWHSDMLAGKKEIINKLPTITLGDLELMLYNIRNGEYSDILCHIHCNAIQDEFIKLHGENARLHSALEKLYDLSQPPISQRNELTILRVIKEALALTATDKDTPS